MTGRERVLTAMRRDEPDCVPYSFSLTPPLTEEFKRRFAGENPAEHYGFPARDIGQGPSKKERPDFSGYYEGRNLPENTQINEWGVAHEPSSDSHFTHIVSPLAGDITVKDVEEYPWPDFGTDYRFEEMPEQVRMLHEKGLAVRSISDFSTFDFSWAVRGYEELLTDMVVNERIAAAIMDRVCECVMSFCANSAKAGCDIVGVGEDVGSQRGLIMSPDMWRKWIKPRFAKIVVAVRSAKPDVLFFYHSDGDIRDVIPDLIEIGVDILNPVQPECMDPAEIKKLYGDTLAFWGTIGTQTTMPFGTPEEVRKEVKNRIEIVGKGGGLFLAPSHVLEPEVPWENIEAFVSAVRQFGRY